MDGLNIRKLYGKKINPIRNYRAAQKNKEVSNGVNIINRSRLPIPISYGTIMALLQKIFKYLKPGKSSFLQGSWSLGIAFLNDKQIKGLNQKYRKANRPTDVLAFDYGQNTADLAISLESAKRNARFYKTSLTKELVRYIIHGILHLHGYKDRNPKERKAMFGRQEEIFKKITHGNFKNRSHSIKNL